MDYIVYYEKYVYIFILEIEGYYNWVYIMKINRGIFKMYKGVRLWLIRKLSFFRMFFCYLYLDLNYNLIVFYY